MVRIVGLLLALIVASAGFAFAGAHAAQRGNVSTLTAPATPAPHCAGDSSSPASGPAIDDLSCSLLCCAVAAPTAPQIMGRMAIVRAVADISARVRSLDRAPPAPPPRGA